MATVTTPTLTGIDGGLLLPPTTDGRARFSREAYHRLGQMGVLCDDDHVELIDGEIFMMLPIGPSQGSYITRLADFFIRGLPPSAQCRVQLPIVMSDHSEPEPDLCLVHRHNDDYQSGHPIPTDILLIVEVSQASLSFDLGRKSELYARAGIVEYWVVNVDRKEIVVHRLPGDGQYGNIVRLPAIERLAPVSFPQCELDLNWLFR